MVDVVPKWYIGSPTCWPARRGRLISLLSCLALLPITVQFVIVTSGHIVAVALLTVILPT